MSGLRYYITIRWMDSKIREVFLTIFWGGEACELFTNPYREMCVNILEKLLPRRAVQDSTLLQAYATFHMMKEVTLSGANYAEIYRAASRKSAPYLYALLADFAALKMPFPEAFVLMFDVQLDYFLRCVTPSLVADLRSFHRFFEEYGAPNLAAKVII